MNYPVFRAALRGDGARGRAALHVMVPPAGDPKGNGQTKLNLQLLTG